MKKIKEFVKDVELLSNNVMIKIKGGDGMDDDDIIDYPQTPPKK